jgi:hypothetical protein
MKFNPKHSCCVCGVIGRFDQKANGENENIRMHKVSFGLGGNVCDAGRQAGSGRQSLFTHVVA